MLARFTLFAVRRPADPHRARGSDGVIANTTQNNQSAAQEA